MSGSKAQLWQLSRLTTKRMQGTSSATKVRPTHGTGKMKMAACFLERVEENRSPLCNDSHIKVGWFHRGYTSHEFL